MLWVLALATLLAQGDTAGETAVVSSIPAANHPLARGTQLVLICKYTTLNLKGAVKWMHKGQELNTEQKKGISAGAAEEGLSVSQYTITKIAMSDAGAYTCSAEYTTSEKIVKSVTPVTLQVIDVAMTISSETAAEGSKVTVTCNYDQYAGSGTPTIAWFKNDNAFSPEQNKAVSEGDNCGDTQRNRYIISSTTTADTGKYKCKATYTNDGEQVVAEPDPAEGKSLSVRKLSTTAKDFHVEVGDNIEIVCTVNGDEPDTFKWYASDGAELSTEVFSITLGSHTNNEKTSTLKITSASETNHQKSFKCKASWSSFEPKILEETVELKVYGAAKKCNKGTGGDSLTEETCGEESKCTSPMFVEYTGMSDQAYGCGACPGATKDKTCTECDAVDAVCNVKVEEAKAKTFKCFDYEYKTTEKKWKAKATAETCHAKEATPIKCNSPGEKADKDYVMPAKGCGPCVAEAKTAKKCAECTKAECNSASTLAFVLVPLLAVIFHAL